MSAEQTAGETSDTRLRRLRMRSWRRGMREMDLILGPFAEADLADFSAAQLAQYEALLDENDQSLYRWISGIVSGQPHHDMPDPFVPLLTQIAALTVERVQSRGSHS